MHGPQHLHGARAYLEFAIAEFIITLGIIINTKVGVRNEWHRRWLDYRQLAERLRPMRSLKLLGLAAPDPPGTMTNPVALRWIDWYASGIWRAIGCPGGAIEATARPKCQAVAAIRGRPAGRLSRKECPPGRQPRPAARAHRDLLFWATLVAGASWSSPGRAFADWVNRYLVHFDLGGLPGARYRRIRNPLPGRFRRQRSALAGHGATPCGRSNPSWRAAPSCRAPPTSPSRPRAPCSSTSTNGG